MGLKTLAKRIGLTSMILAMMIKGALPPTIAMAMYQSHSVANVYGNFGFLIIVTSILAMPLQPRARFFQNIALSTVCIYQSLHQPKPSQVYLLMTRSSS